MSISTANAAVNLMFQTPSPVLKVEFQGGEPLLAFDTIKHIVEACESRAACEQRTIEFVLCSNLTTLTEGHLEFLGRHNFQISTSIDGPCSLHNENRVALGGNSYDRVVAALSLVQERLGRDRVAALMTTTRGSLEQPEAIVDEYVARGFSSIFLRALNPYGFASNQWDAIGYSMDEWLRFYRRALQHIIELNRSGVHIREEFAALMLRRMLTPYGDGYVDLQSPTGCGLRVLTYGHDGGLYLSDEGRMLAAMGDETFRFGTVNTSSFRGLLSDPRYLELIDSTMTEGTPECIDCAFQPFCGADPVRQYRTTGDVVGHKAGAAFCQKIRSIVGHLAALLEDTTARQVLESWV